MEKKVENKKLSFLIKDVSELVDRILSLFKEAWSLGIDIAILLAQVVSVWEWFMTEHVFAKTVGKWLTKLKL